MNPDFDRRREWADRRQKSDRVATFAAGEIVRCPATRRTRDGIEVVCGHGRDEVGPGTRVTVRADRRATDRQTGALNRICEQCHAKLRVEVVAVAVAA